MNVVLRLRVLGLLPVSLLAVAMTAGCSADTRTESSADEDVTSSALAKCKPNADAAARCQNQAEFVTARGGAFYPGPMYRGAMESANDPATRQVQESDVYRLAGSSLFILNQARGFQVIDVTQQDSPRMIGREDIAGYPREMYVDTAKKRAYILVDSTPRYADQSVTQVSRVAVVDYASRTAPKVIGSVDIDGNIVESRRVGDVVYVVSNVWIPASGATPASQQTVVKSIYVGGRTPRVVDTLSFAGTSYQIHASDKFLFLGQYNGQETTIDLYDISDAQGHIVHGQAVTVPGYLQDRFSMNMDAASGVLRVVSHAWDGSGTIHVKTFSVANATRPTPLGSLALPNIGTLLATKFDGAKAYLVHQVRIDPLDVIDLSNPAQPTRLSSLVIPGWLQDLEVRGDRVVGIGIDNTTGTNRVAVAIYDVSNPTATREMSRTLLGEGAQHQWANFWESRTFKLLDDRGLLLVPFSAWSASTSFQTVQLVDVDLPGGVVKARGRVDAASEAIRSFGLDKRVGSLSYRRLSVANVDDRDNPFVSASVELSRNVVDFTKTNSSGVQLVTDWQNPAELRAVPLSNADAELPAAFSVLPFPGAERVYPSGQDVVVVSHESPSADSYVTRLTSIDYSDPRKPVRRGDIKLVTNGSLYGFGAGGATTQSEVMQLSANLFVLAQDNGKERNFELVSFANPMNPQVLSTAGVPNKGDLVEIRLLGDSVYVTTFEPTPQPVSPTPGPVVDPPAAGPSNASFMPPFGRIVQTGKHYLTRIAFDGVRLSPSQPVNVPGVLVDVDVSGRLITLDPRVSTGGAASIDMALDTLKVSFAAGSAKLKDLLDTDDGVATAMLRGSSLYYTTTEQGPNRCPPMARCAWWGSSASNWTLHTVEVRGNTMTEGASLLLQKNGAGSVLDIQSVGAGRYGFVSFGVGGFGLLDLSVSSAPRLKTYLAWNGWANDVLVDTARRDATLWLGDSGVRTIALP